MAQDFGSKIRKQRKRLKAGAEWEMEVE